MKNPVNLYVILGIFVVLSVSYFIFYMLKRQEGLANKKEKNILTLIDQMNEKNAKLEEQLTSSNGDYLLFLEAKKTNIILTNLIDMMNLKSSSNMKDIMDIQNYLQNTQQA